jgi:hypothetical protein
VTLPTSSTLSTLKTSSPALISSAVNCAGYLADYLWVSTRVTTGALITTVAVSRVAALIYGFQLLVGCVGSQGRRRTKPSGTELIRNAHFRLGLKKLALL